MRPLFAFASLCFVASCHDVTEPPVPAYIDHVAILSLFGNSSRVMAPDTVFIGVPFYVTFWSYAGGCTRDLGEDKLSLSGTVLEIRAYDRSVNRGATSCPDDIRFMIHHVPIALGSAGEYQLRVVGDKRDQPSSDTRLPIELTRSLTVREPIQMR
jgi:hypothetical protein